MADHRVVIVGGGIAGIILAMRLGRRAGARRRTAVTLVDATPAHVWKPMLHAFASGTADYRSESLSFLAHSARNGYAFVPGTLVGVDRATREVELGPIQLRDGASHLGGTRLPYDTLVLAVGSRTNDFGTPGVAEHCHTLDNLVRAERFHDDVRAAAVDALERGDALTVAIVGGGATGVELAAELSSATDILAGLLPSHARPRLRLTLIESNGRILGALPERVSAAALTKLKELGATVELGAKVASADATGFALADGRRVDAAVRVWTAGVAAPDVLAGIEGLEVNRTGQLLVGPTLQTTRDPAIFAIGDCASVLAQANGQAHGQAHGQAVPTTAQAARQQAVFLAGSLYRALRFGRRLRRFTFKDFGSIVSLGGYTAYGSLGQHGLLPASFIEGRVAQLGHAALYRAHQIELNGLVRGGALILSDGLRGFARPAVRLD